MPKIFPFVFSHELKTYWFWKPVKKNKSKLLQFHIYQCHSFGECEQLNSFSTFLHIGADCAFSFAKPHAICNLNTFY